MGHDIYLTLKDGGGAEEIDVIDLGLSMIEAVTKLGLKTEIAKLDKPRRISQKLLDNLPQSELFLLTNMLPEELKETPLTTTYRVELNAMTPEQFLSWLKRKLATAGILEKVYPPHEVVKAEVKAVTKEASHKHLVEEILSIVGEDSINYLESKLCELEEYSGYDYDGFLHKALEEYPKEGWRDIVGSKVKERVGTRVGLSWVKDEIRAQILARLKEE